MAAKKRKTVKFHTDIYPEPAVRAAAKEYAELAAVVITRKGKYIIASISPSVGLPQEELADEFANCALFNSK